MENENAQRPSHHQERISLSGSEGDSTLKLRNRLNLIFMLAAVVGVIVYLCSSHDVGIIIMIAAVVVKAVEVVIRMIR